eukprot:CAMPEP_0113900032 /NCGR_PEP_ID=MMETSP0780_2-20120614/20421_1 /TAXON_ID=652834 /ORGANISM="Palpitomonas bilix" /LENGTH=288 /DNA_ID=CAMNT_0000892385 /DNA_START=157 /DNA_END=1023 /DNA_ORIENTATION=- /assembly_acc=CAM_ASM_000599
MNCIPGFDKSALVVDDTREEQQNTLCICHTPDGTGVFLKIVPYAVPGERRQAFVDQIRPMYESENPHTLRLFGLWVDDDSVHFAGEYARFGSLADIIRVKGCLPEIAMRAVAKQAVDALFYLHNIRNPPLLHRSVKPTNLVVDGEGVVKLTDFGLGREIRRLGAAVATFARVDRGLYMSPERIEANQYGVNSDVWGLGITLMECMIGSYPYDAGMSDPQLMETIVTQPSPELARDMPVTSECRDFLARCLIKDPSERPGSHDLRDHPFIRDMSEEEARSVLLGFLTSP